MRELEFVLEYEPGCNTVADTLAEYPDARIRSLSLHATTESLWRVDHVTGSTDALAAIKEAFLATDYYTDCLTPDHCGASQRTRVLESADDMLVLYSYWERTSSCASVPHMALERLGQGVLFETQKEQRRYTWRIVHSGEGEVRAFFDDLEESVADCVDIDFQRLTDASPPTSTSPGRRSTTDCDVPRNTSRNSGLPGCVRPSGPPLLTNRATTCWTPEPGNWNIPISDVGRLQR